MNATPNKTAKTRAIAENAKVVKITERAAPAAPKKAPAKPAAKPAPVAKKAPAPKAAPAPAAAPADPLAIPAFLARQNTPESDAKVVAMVNASEAAARREKIAEAAAQRTSDAAAAAKAARPATKSEPAKRGGKRAAAKPNVSAAGLSATIKVKGDQKVRADGLPENGIDDYLIDAVLAKGGALHSAMCKKLGWKRCSRRLARAAEVAKVTLVAEKVGNGDIRFTGTRA